MSSRFRLRTTTAARRRRCWPRMSPMSSCLWRPSRVPDERTERITIGSHCMFANYCFVADADHRYDDATVPVTWQGMQPKGPVKIEDNCWFGTNCVVTGGVTIGERTVVGANSVVTKDLPAGV